MAEGSHPAAAPLIGPPAPGVTAVDIDGRFSVYNPISQRVLTLNETASDVWRLCDGESDATAIVDALAAAYRQPADEIRGSVVETLSLFAAEGLLSGGVPATDRE